MASEQALAAWGEYNAALKVLRDTGAGRHDGIEQRVGIAYQKLVRLGEAQQIRRKYRGR